MLVVGHLLNNLYIIYLRLPWWAMLVVGHLLNNLYIIYLRLPWRAMLVVGHLYITYISYLLMQDKQIRP